MPDEEVSILDRVIRGDEPQPINPYTKTLIYADPGAGKTVLAATAPKPFFLDTENSTEVLDDWPELKKECNILPIRHTDDLMEVVMLLQNGEPSWADRKTLVLDTISEGQMRNLSEIIKVAAKKDAARSPYIAYQNEYKESGEQLRRILVAMRALPMHIIVLAHRVEDKDETTGRVFIRPDLPPKLAATSKGIFGLQAYLTYEIDPQTDTFKNTLYTRQTRKAEAKTRYRFIPSAIENPTYQDVIDAKMKMVNLGYDEDSTPAEDIPVAVPGFDLNLPKEGEGS